MHSEHYIGLMSGTSMNAVDAVLVDFATKPFQLVATYSQPIATELKQALLAICKSGNDEINRMGQLDVQLGILFANTCQALLKKTQLPAKQIHAIGSHGQTIRHQPNFSYPFTLQIGDPNIIANNTGIVTVADFRRRDIANGGQGAPLAPAFHNALFRDAQQNRVILNIGGIANITLLPANLEKSVTGFDTGPGNTLLDAWAMQYLNRPHDDQGKWAASGKINQQLLSALLQDPYFSKQPPKSTGREYFNLSWLQEKLDLKSIATEDIQATLTELTAQSIMQAIQRFGFNDYQLIVCGGGAHNQFLMQRLTALKQNHHVSTTKDFGIDPDWIEAIALAWLAKQTLENKPGNLPEVTGAKRSVVLGGIYK